MREAGDGFVIFDAEDVGDAFAGCWKLDQEGIGPLREVDLFVCHEGRVAGGVPCAVARVALRGYHLYGSTMARRKREAKPPGSPSSETGEFRIGDPEFRIGDPEFRIGVPSSDPAGLVLPRQACWPGAAMDGDEVEREQGEPRSRNLARLALGS